MNIRIYAVAGNNEGTCTAPGPITLTRTGAKSTASPLARPSRAEQTPAETALPARGLMSSIPKSRGGYVSEMYRNHHYRELFSIT